MATYPLDSSGYKTAALALMKTKLVHVRLDPNRIAVFTRAAKSCGISFSALVPEAVAKFLEKAARVTSALRAENKSVIGSEERG